MGDLDMDLFSPHTLPRTGAVIGIAACDLESHDLTLMIDEQVELEAKEPAHGGEAPLCQSLDHPVVPDTWLVADRQLGAVGKIDPGSLSTTTMQ